VINSYLDISVSDNRDIIFSFMCVSYCDDLDSVLKIKSSAVIQDKVQPKFIKIILSKLINTRTHQGGRQFALVTKAARRVRKATSNI